MQPDSKKIKATVLSTEPKNATEVHSFLGMVNYVSRLIPRMAMKAQPLRVLTKKDTPLNWDPKEAQALESLKKSLLDADAMVFFNTEKKCTLHDWNGGCQSSWTELKTVKIVIA